MIGNSRAKTVSAERDVWLCLDTFGQFLLILYARSSQPGGYMLCVLGSDRIQCKVAKPLRWMCLNFLKCVAMRCPKLLVSFAGFQELPPQKMLYIYIIIFNYNYDI